MYLAGWVLLVAASLVLSFGAFGWALRTGQFADQSRARYLALEDLPPPPTPRRRRPAEVYALAVVAILVCLGLLAPVVLWLVRR